VLVGVGTKEGEGVAVGVGVWVAPGVKVWVGGAARSGRAVPIARDQRIIASPDATSSLLIASRFIVIPPRARDVLAL
jgi:hypothetical protein